MRVVDLQAGAHEDGSAGVEWVVQGLLPRRFASCIFGAAGVSKSLLALWIALHVAIGRPVFGLPVASGPVLFVDAELDRATTRERAVAMARSIGLDEVPAGLRYLALRGETLTNYATAKALHSVVVAESPVLVVVDSFRQSAMDVDPNDAAQVQQVMAVLDSIAATCNTAVFVIDHSTAKDDPKPIGSVSKLGVVRAAHHLTDAGKGRVMLRTTKMNFGPPAPPLLLTASIAIQETGTCSFELAGLSGERTNGSVAESPARADIAKAKILELLANGPATDRDLAAASGLKVKTIQNRAYELRQGGQLVRDGKSWALSAGESLKCQSA